MYDLTKLTGPQLVELKKKLKLLESLKKNLGKRAQREFHRIENAQSYYLVEYFPAMGLKGAQESASVAFLRFLGVDVGSVVVEYKENEFLGGGLRILKDDSMVDLSYAKVQDVIKNA